MNLLFGLLIHSLTLEFYFRRDKSRKALASTAPAPSTSNRTKDQRTAKNSSDDLSALSLKNASKNRNQIVEHHNTLPISYYKQKKRTATHRKNATLERTTTKKTNETLLLTSDTQPKLQSNSNEATIKMHYHNAYDMPRYLFGERTKQSHQQSTQQQSSHMPKSMKSDEIYLNKSGWVQVHQREFDKSPPIRCGNRDQSFQKYSNASNSMASTNFSKLEALISRNENRKNIEAKMINKCAIDSNVSALLSERPGFLPIKRFDDSDSPPPITPIISPPPAFQDNNGSDIATAIQQTGTKATPNGQENASAANNKGMVFSRSFEYDTRKPYEYNQTFSKSFDYDFLSPTKEEKRIEKENNFVNLTGVSPNYLSKKPTSSGTTLVSTTTTTSAAAPTRDTTAVYQQYLEPKPYVESVRKSRVRTAFSLQPELVTPTEQQQIERSRRGQFAKQESSSSSGGSQQQQQQQQSQQQHGFRSMHPSVNKRLNSCDSGARSGRPFSFVPFAFADCM